MDGIQQNAAQEAIARLSCFRAFALAIKVTERVIEYLDEFDVGIMCHGARNLSKLHTQIRQLCTGNRSSEDEVADQSLGLQDTPKNRRFQQHVAQDGNSAIELLSGIGPCDWAAYQTGVRAHQGPDKQDEEAYYVQRDVNEWINYRTSSFSYALNSYIGVSAFHRIQ